MKSIKWQSATSIMAEPDPESIVAGIFTRGSITTIVAESGTGKTFLALALASAISAGEEWCGRAVTRGSVVLIHFEGDALGKRVRALVQEGFDITNVYFIRPKGSLSPRVDRATGLESPSELETEIKRQLHDLIGHLEAGGKPPIVLMVLDTLRASLSGSEDSSENVSAYLRAGERIAATALPSAALGVVHHAGWQDGKGGKARERGSSALRGNVDINVYLAKGKPDPMLAQLGKHELLLTTPKLRDDEEPEALSLIRRKVYLLGASGAQDEDIHGDPVSSCVIEGAEAPAVAMMRKVLLTIAAHPLLSSKTDLAAVLSKNKPKIAAALNAAVAAGMIGPPVKTHPYSLTPKGLAFIEGTGPAFVWSVEG